MMPGAPGEVVLRVEGLCKRFPHVEANKNISFELQRGEIHCLLGENGAGKSTLAQCLYGAYRADKGLIAVGGQAVSIAAPRDAIALGIGMVHQHFVLVPPFTVLENIIVGAHPSGGFIRLSEARKKIQALCNRYLLEIDLDAVVSRLAVGQQQWVEILKALYMGVRILILDEPTSVLTPQEAEKLFCLLLQMRSEGIAVVLITHKLNEVMSISDRVTVLRQGEVIATLPTAQVTKEELAWLMVGRELNLSAGVQAAQPGGEALRLKDVHVANGDRRERLHEVELSVRRGEILGLAGVSGNGQSALFDAIVGVASLSRGQILQGDEDLTRLSPFERAERGLASIPPDRLKQGLLLDLNVGENLILGRQRSAPFRAGLGLNVKEIETFARQSIRDYEIQTAGAAQKAGVLSGGNLQKLILARELSRPIKSLVASSPTRGLDVGATLFVHERLVQLRDQGVAILLISEDLDEVLRLSDRVAVIFRGRIMRVFQKDEASREQIGLLMAGVSQGAA